MARRDTEMQVYRPVYGDDRGRKQGTEVASWVMPQVPREARILPPDAARAGTRQREQVVSYLAGMHARGFLGKEAFDARVAVALEAETVQELSALEADLPLSRHRRAQEHAEDAGLSPQARARASVLGFSAWLAASGLLLMTGIILVITAMPVHHAVLKAESVTGVMTIIIGITSIITSLVVADATSPLKRLQNRSSKH